ncbi:RidA family protein [Amycolatopsis anabasis]|uniref:RidA family protein n=1 Tax=Amycolatopsis anabasis TaxID=1840409 RepID=UPI00131E494D|nr:RidA family protein [Amycolatopsis anabasis]
MTIKRHNPAELHTTPGYHHVTTVEAQRLVFLAGQCPLAADGSVVAGDLAAQVDQVVANTAAALRSAGATPDDVVRTVIYVASADQAELAAVWTRLTESPIGAAFSTASTLLGVAQLGYPDQRVELDVTAALP